MNDPSPRRFRAGQRCPRCGLPLLRIVYGYPSEELMDAAQRGELLLGGCVLMEDDPTHECADGHRWGRRA